MGNTTEENIDRIRFGLFQNSLDLEVSVLQYKHKQGVII